MWSAFILALKTVFSAIAASPTALVEFGKSIAYFFKLVNSGLSRVFDYYSAQAEAIKEEKATGNMLAKRNRIKAKTNLNAERLLGNAEVITRYEQIKAMIEEAESKDSEDEKAAAYSKILTLRLAKDNPNVDNLLYDTSKSIEERSLKIARITLARETA